MKKLIFSISLLISCASGLAQSQKASKTYCVEPPVLIKDLLLVTNNEVVALDNMIYKDPSNPKYQLSAELSQKLSASAALDQQNQPSYTPDVNIWVGSSTTEIQSIAVTKVKKYFETWLIYTNFALTDGSSHEITMRYVLNRQSQCWELDDVISKRLGSLHMQLRNKTTLNN